MKRLITSAILTLCIAMCSSCVVWEKPYASRYSGNVDITRVEFKPDETVVTLSWLGKGNIRMMTPTYLRVDTMKYMIREHADAPLNEWIMRPRPANTRQFDFIEDVERGFRVNAVVNLSDTVLDLIPSNWRNDATGDWMLSLLPEKAIYNSRVWDYIDRNEEAKGYTVSIACGEERHTLHISKEKNLVRKISIDGGKPIACSRILKHFLSDYPTQDLRDSFVDTEYKVDTAIVRGWLYGMNRNRWAEGKEFSAVIYNIFTQNHEKFTAKMDSTGQFELKVPLYGASEVYADWSRSNLHFVLEPGKEYFLYVNFQTGQKLLMGDDCRLQNEMLAHPSYRFGRIIEAYQRDVRNLPVEQSTVYMDTARKDLSKCLQNLQDFVAQHPKISTRWQRFVEVGFRMGVARNLGQFSFNVKNRELSQEVKDYLALEYGENLPRPYTLFRDLGTYVRDIRWVHRQPYLNLSATDVEKMGAIQLTDEERQFFQMEDSIGKEWIKLSRARVGKDSISRWMTNTPWVVKVMEEKENKKLDESERGKLISAVVDSLRKAVPTLVLDLTKFPQDLRDICAALDYYAESERNSEVHTDGTYELLMDSLKLPATREYIQALHDKYMKLSQMQTYAIRNASDVKDMTDGEAILSKLTEPYRGRCIVLDVWGTWCGPCKAALRDSKHEFEALDPLNVRATASKCHPYLPSYR